MILPAQVIRKLNIIKPFHERTRSHGMTYGLGPAGYDVRIAELIDMRPGKFSLASTLEQFVMPDDVLGYVKDKSTWARQGVCVQNTVIEPGWRGHLTLEITNHARDSIVLLPGMPIAQIVFHRLEQLTEQPYEGKYQDQEAGPVAAKYDYHGGKR